MKTILFVCHGNICRSPAAEWIMKLLLIKYHLDDKFYVFSRATSTEEIGNDIYPPMKRALYARSVPFFEHHAKQITEADYERADYIFYMDNNNLRYLNYLIEDKDKKYVNIAKFTANLDYIDDPWYTGSFDEVVDQLFQCCDDIIKNLR